MNAEWYFSAPWDPLPVRRGDALGLRAGADYFADLIAPGLNNGTSDARWITLLSWCLKWSHIAWHNAGGGDLSRRDVQRARYAWLRPLELLWVDRTLESGQTTGQLRGRRSIERWRKDDYKSLNFAMSDDQFRRYRQVGTYGAYRVLFRTITGLTSDNDGWTPGDTALKLADIVNENLPGAAQLNQEHFEKGTKWGAWSDAEARYWIKHGWCEWTTKASHSILPTPGDSTRNRLPGEEGRILKAALFTADSNRLATANVLSEAKAAQTHAEICDMLAKSNLYSSEISAKLKPLPAFTRLADAAMDVMRTLWIEINSDPEAPAPSIDRLARSTDLQPKFKKLQDMSREWLSAPGREGFPHDPVATQLAQSMQNAASPSDQIRALAKHHHKYGGGRHWFREGAGALEPIVADTGIAASDYRFRLRALCLLAAQCGVSMMGNALNILDKDRFGEAQVTKEQEADNEGGAA